MMIMFHYLDKLISLQVCCKFVASLEEKMASLKVNIGIGMDISESTANCCLKIIELYLNQNQDKTVVPCRYPDGDVCLELVDADELEDEEDEEDDEDD